MPVPNIQWLLFTTDKSPARRSCNFANAVPDSQAIVTVVLFFPQLARVDAAPHNLHAGEPPYRTQTPVLLEPACMTSYLSDPRKHTSATAGTMTDVRYEIDRIDRLLVAILAERQSFIDAAARIKGDRKIVHDRPRIEDVVSKVVAEAQRAGLSPAIAEPVWRTLIDRCIAYEFESFDRLNVPVDANS